MHNTHANPIQKILLHRFLLVSAQKKGGGGRDSGTMKNAVLLCWSSFDGGLAAPQLCFCM